MSPRGIEILNAEKRRQRELRKAREEQWKKLPKKKRKIEKLRSCFTAYDTDGSGLLSVNEFQRLAVDVCVPMSPEKLTGSFTHIDSDHSGTIDFQEFKNWYVTEKRKSGASKKMQRFLKKRVKGVRDGGAMDLAYARRQIVLEVIKRSKNHAIVQFRKKHPEVAEAHRIIEHGAEDVGSKSDIPDFESDAGVPEEDASVKAEETRAQADYDNRMRHLLDDEKDMKQYDTDGDGIVSASDLATAAMKNKDLDLSAALKRLELEQAKHATADDNDDDYDEDDDDWTDISSVISAATDRSDVSGCHSPFRTNNVSTTRNDFRSTKLGSMPTLSSTSNQTRAASKTEPAAAVEDVKSKAVVQSAQVKSECVEQVPAPAAIAIAVRVPDPEPESDMYGDDDDAALKKSGGCCLPCC